AFYSYQNEHAKAVRLQGEVDELTVRQRATELKLEDSKKMATRLQLELQEVKGQIDTLSKELAQEKSSRLDASNKLEQLKADLQQQKASRQDLEERLNQTGSEGLKMKEQIRVIQKQKDELEAKLKELEGGADGVELGKVVVNGETPQEGAQAEAAIDAKADKKAASLKAKVLEGKVMVVNKDYNFAVINLGSKDGVKIDDVFSVLRGGKVIGELKVEKVHESMSAAGFSEDMKNIIKENDIVAQKAK
ncbi:MAG: hypothetical protein PHP10_05875, partial [Candidatus Omnitrophica bacterium]|nr:hypothetical protein [Candidatus Omnitrophota bacterium]